MEMEIISLSEWHAPSFKEKSLYLYIFGIESPRPHTGALPGCPWTLLGTSLHPLDPHNPPLSHILNKRTYRRRADNVTGPGQ